MKPTDLARRLTAYLSEFLPGQRNASPNTVKSYAQAFTLLLRHFRDHRKLSPERLTLDHLAPDAILEFLRTLEDGRNCCVRTRNQRLAAIRSFFRYLQALLPERLSQCQRILAIPPKRAPRNTTINHLTPTCMKALLAQPDQHTVRGRRDATLLALLYDTAMRVQELSDLTPGQLRLESPAHVNVTGKGRKRRLIPLLRATVALLRNYLAEQGLDAPETRSTPLFHNRQGQRLAPNGVRYIVRKYARRVEKSLGTARVQVTPHTFRHSKAMHLLQSGNPLVVVQSFLGHADIQTTTVYARADIEMTRAALASSPVATPKARTPSWEKQPGLLAWLQSL